MTPVLVTRNETALPRMHWQVMPKYREILLGKDGLRFNDWLDLGAVRLIKHGPHRTVYRIELPEVRFFLKHYRLANTRAWLRELVRPSKARMEYDRALAVAARGVPTIVPLGLGEEPGWAPGESCLLTQTLEDTEPLNQFLEMTFPRFAPTRQEVLRKRLSLTLARLLVQMHDQGIRHNDLHAGNVLIRLSADDQPYLFLIDLHAVHLGGPLKWHARQENLVLLNRYFSLRSSRSDRLRFWSEYCHGWESGGVRKHKVKGQVASDSVPLIDLIRGSYLASRSPSLTLARQRARNLEQLTWDSNLRLWQGRERRCLASNRLFHRIGIYDEEGRTVQGMAVTDLDRECLSRLLTDPEEPFRGPQRALLKDGPSSTVAVLTMTVHGQEVPVVYKRFRLGMTAKKRLRAVLGRPKHLRSWICGHSLKDRGLPTARPLAMFTARSAKHRHNAYLLTEKIPDAIDLLNYVTNIVALPDEQRRVVLSQRIEQLALLIRDMHRRQVSHRDLKANNILVQNYPGTVRNPGGDFGPFWLIDLVGVGLRGPLSRHRRIQNLARLHASFCHNPAIRRTDKLRFLRVYLQWGLRGKNGWKAWWREIGQATQAKVALNQRHRRPLD